MLSSLIRKVLPGWRNMLLAVLSAVLLILAFPDFEWWFTAWFALVPLMWAIEREQASIARSFALGWIFGTLFFFGTCWWLTFAPITYAGFPWPLAYFLMLIVTIMVGVFPAIFAAILSVLLRRFGSWAFLAAPFVWVFSEFLRYWLTGNNWNAIGYSQFNGGLALKLAAVGGVMLTSAVLVIPSAFLTYLAVNYGRFMDDPKTAPFYATIIFWIVGWPALKNQAIKREIWRVPDYDIRLPVVALVFGSFAVMFLWAVFVGVSPDIKNSTLANIVAIQPNVPMSGLDYQKWNTLRQRQIDVAETELQRLPTADRQLPTLVILPESPMNFMYEDDREFQKFINDFARRNNVSVLFNSAEPDRSNGKFFNSAVMIDPEGRKVAQYDKIYLLPFGEAVPVPFESFVPAFVGSFSYGREYDLLPLGETRAGVMICFESHFGQLSREYVRNGADVIIEMTNDGYLGPTPVLRQHLANAVFRAVETNKPVLRVTNVGITAYINERGQVLDPAASYTEATRVWTVSKSDGQQTFYVKYGDWFAWFCTVITLLMIGISVARRSVPIANSVTLPIDPNKFWGANYYHHPPLTEKMIGAGEKKLGVKLPEELIELLRVQNGGYTAGFVFPMDVKTTWACDHIPLSDLAGLVLDNGPETPMNLLDSVMLGKEWGVPERQILLSGDGHYWVTLDYRKGERPTVAWIDTECGEDIQIASSFHEFLVGLIPTDEFDTAEDFI